jgi:hypothetical protein
MDATRWTPRIGAACAAVMLLVLAVPAGAMAASTISFNGTLITYVDAVDANDRVQVQLGEDELEQVAYEFAPLVGGAALQGENGCSPDDDPPNSVSCPQGTHQFIFQLGGGNDLVDVSLLDVNSDRPSEVAGGPGDDQLRGSREREEFSGGPGDDHMMGVVGPDVYRGGDGTDTIEYQGPGPWTVSLDGVSNDGPINTSPIGNVHPDVEIMLGGGLGDTLTGAAGKQTIDGRGGNDTLDGGPDGDALAGGAGNDTILARDGGVDTITCGADADVVTADWNDVTDADCETVNRSVRDDDGDGSPNGVDCNDANPAVKPGAGDIPGNGVDDDCDGVDVILDRDGDGASAAVDCDDANPARRPGAADVPANGVDEDCDGRDAAIPALRPAFSASWNVFGNGTELTKLRVSGAPKRGAKLSVRCKGGGCPFKRKSVKLRDGRANLTKRFKHKRLRPGVVIELRVTADGMIGKVQRLTIRKRKEPKRVTLCLAPGASKPKRCG